MSKNIIVLTAGLTGSSVLTSLFAKTGYWVGDATKKKSDYDTWENSKLVEINDNILQQAGFFENWVMEFKPEYITRIVNAGSTLDPESLDNFIKTCSQHQPWIWKDPRLWLTIRHWIPFIPKENLCFIVLRREPLQAWISGTIRRQIQTLDYLKRYYGGIHQTMLEFLEQEQLSYIDISYEQLILEPEFNLARINALAGTQLGLNHFKSVFKGKLYQRQHGLLSFLKAAAIYLKNYSARYK